MKKLGWLLCLVFLLTCFPACSPNLTEKSDIISLYRKNEEMFLTAAANGDYSAVERIRGVQTVYLSENCVEITCGGSGLGSSTHYYGLFYSEGDDLCGVSVAGRRSELVPHGDGYLYEEDGGDNRYYVEPLGNHFFYYEAHF